MLNIEQLMELTKMLDAAVQQLQQQLIQQQENFQKQEAVLHKQQTDVQKQIVSADGIVNLLSEFIYKPKERITFPAYFKRYETIFAKHFNHGLMKKKLY